MTIGNQPRNRNRVKTDHTSPYQNIKHAHLRIQTDLHTLEHEALHLGNQRLLNRLQLRRNNREHRRINAIKLVEAAPRPTLTQPIQILANRLVVHALTTVRHHAQQAHSLGQVLHRLRLAGARRPCRRIAQVHGQTLRDRQVNAVREWRDHESAIQAHVLIAVAEFAGALADHQLVGVAHPVEAQLRLPLELARVQNAVAHKAVHDVLGVHVYDEHRVQLLALVLGERGRADLGDDLFELGVQLARVGLHGHLVAVGDLLEHVLDLPRPPDLIGRQHNHSLVVVHPLYARLLVLVVVDGLLGDQPVGSSHLGQHLAISNSQIENGLFQMVLLIL
jgi:hypothetical protein